MLCFRLKLPHACAICRLWLLMDDTSDHEGSSAALAVEMMYIYICILQL